MLTTCLWLTALLHIMVEGFAIEKSSLEHNEDLHEETGYPDSLSGSFYFRPSPRQPFLQLNLIPYPLIFPYGVPSSSVDIEKHDVTSSNLFNIPSRMMDPEWWPTWLEQSHPSRFIVKKRNFPKVNREKMVINWRAAHLADETNDPENEELDAIKSNKDTSILDKVADEQKGKIDSLEKQTDRLGAFMSPSIEMAIFAPELEIKQGNINTLEEDIVEIVDMANSQVKEEKTNKPSSNEENEKVVGSSNEQMIIDSEKSIEIVKVPSENITGETEVKERKSSSKEIEEYISLRGNASDVNDSDEGINAKLTSDEKLSSPFADFEETSTSGANKKSNRYENNSEHQNSLNVKEIPTNNEKNGGRNSENILEHISLPEISENTSEFPLSIVLEKEKQTKHNSAIDLNGTVYINKERISDFSENQLEKTTKQDIIDLEKENEKTQSAVNNKGENQKGDDVLDTNNSDEKDTECKKTQITVQRHTVNVGTATEKPFNFGDISEAETEKGYIVDSSEVVGNEESKTNASVKKGVENESSVVDSQNNNINPSNQLNETVQEELRTAEKIVHTTHQTNLNNNSNLDELVESLQEEQSKFSGDSQNVDIGTTPANVAFAEESTTRKEMPVVVANIEDHDKHTITEMSDEKHTNIEVPDDSVIASHIDSEVSVQFEDNHFKKLTVEKDVITEPEKITGKTNNIELNEKSLESSRIETSVEDQSTQPENIQKDSVGKATTTDIGLVEDALGDSKKQLASHDDSFILEIANENQQIATEDAIDTKIVHDSPSHSSEDIKTNTNKADENVALEITTIKINGGDIISNERDLGEIRETSAKLEKYATNNNTETNTEKFPVETLNEEKLSAVKSSIQNLMENERSTIDILPNVNEQISLKELSTTLDEVKEDLNEMVGFNETDATILEDNQDVIIEANKSLKNIEVYEVRLEINPSQRLLVDKNRTAAQNEKDLEEIEDQVKDKNVTFQHNDNLYEESNIEQVAMDKLNLNSTSNISYSIEPFGVSDLEAADEISTEPNPPANTSEENVIRIDSKDEKMNNTNETDLVYSNIGEMSGVDKSIESAGKLQGDQVRIENSVDHLDIPQSEIPEAYEINGSYSQLIELKPFNGEGSYLEDSIPKEQNNDSSDVSIEEKISKTESFDISEQGIKTTTDYMLKESNESNETSTETNETQGKENYSLKIEDSTERNDKYESKLAITIQYSNETVINNTYINFEASANNNSESNLANTHHYLETNTERDSKGEELAYSADSALEHTSETNQTKTEHNVSAETITELTNVKDETADSPVKTDVSEEIADEAPPQISNEEINKSLYQGETATSEVLDRPPLPTPAVEGLEEDQLYETDDEYSSESTTENDETEFEEGEEEISENIKNPEIPSSLANANQEKVPVSEIEETKEKV